MSNNYLGVLLTFLLVLNSGCATYSSKIETNGKGRNNTSESSKEVRPQIPPESNLARAKRLMEAKEVGEAIPLLLELSEGGNSEADILLMHLFSNEEYENINYEKARKYLERLAKKGIVNYQLKLARISDSDTWGRARSVEEAIFWYTKVSMQGNNEADLKLSTLYKEIGDYTKSLDLARSAIDTSTTNGISKFIQLQWDNPEFFGSEMFPVFLKACYEENQFCREVSHSLFVEGLLTGVDSEKFLRNIRQEAESGDGFHKKIFAKYTFDNRYVNEEKFRQEVPVIVKYLKDSMNENIKGSKELLNEIFEYVKIEANYLYAIEEYGLAYKLFKILPKKYFDRFAYSAFSDMYRHGKGTVKDVWEAVYLLSDAAKKGSPGWAKYQLGLIYRDDLNSPKQGEGFFKEALKLGDNDALYEILADEKFENWFSIGVTDEVIILIHKDVERATPLRFWSWFYPIDEKKTPETKYFYSLNCRDRVLGNVSFIEYDSSGNTSKSYTFSEDEIRHSPIVPDSVGDAMRKELCETEKSSWSPN